MKKVMLIAVAAMFAGSVIAQDATKAPAQKPAPTEKKAAPVKKAKKGGKKAEKKSAKTEQAK